jgi:hypothetical protein
MLRLQVNDPPDLDIDLGRLVFKIDGKSLRHVLKSTSYDGAWNSKQILQAEAVQDVSDQYINYICSCSTRLFGVGSASPPCWDIGVRKEAHSS